MTDTNIANGGTSLDQVNSYDEWYPLEEVILRCSTKPSSPSWDNIDRVMVPPGGWDSNEYRLHLIGSRYRQATHIDRTLMPPAPGKVLLKPQFLNPETLLDVFKAWDA